jgi:methanogenic corrinoid protein MtbC1
MATITDYSDEPRYNIKSVSDKTEINSVTIRAWERRYNLVIPKRAVNGYRLYSERDIALLLWTRARIEAGLSISSAVAEWEQMKSAGTMPEVVISTSGPIPSRQSGKVSAEVAVQRLLNDLLRHDEKSAQVVFEDALGSFNLTALFESVLAPVLVEVGERWARGEIKVATEHFASNFILSRLLAIFQSLPLHASAPQVMIGCAPDELHVIGPLMLAILLREAGYRVEYLGPDIPLNDLADFICEDTPKMLILSATLKESAIALERFATLLEKCPQPPVFGFGGSAFIVHRELTDRVDGVFLGPSLSQTLEAVLKLVPLKQAKKKST